MRFSASTGLDFSEAYRENVRYDFEGDLILASRNLLLDPRLEITNADGSLRDWPELRAAPTPSGRRIYAARGGARFARQTRNALPLNRSTYFHARHDANGAAPPDPSSRPDYFVPGPVFGDVFDAVGLNGGGYPAGWYYESYAWVIGQIGDPDRRLLTAPAPAIRHRLEEGEAFIRYLPLEAPALALGIAPLMSLPDGEEDELYIQGVIDIRDAIPEYYVMDGPLRRGEHLRAPRGNETFRGSSNELPPVRLKRKKARNKTLRKMDALLSYYLVTREGLTASQRSARIEVDRNQRGAAIAAIFRNLRVPVGTQGIVPQLQIPNGQWYDLHYLQFGSEIPPRGYNPRIYTDDPVLLAESYEYEMMPSERRRQDDSGIPNPDVALRAPIITPASELTAARYDFRATDVYTLDDETGREEESAPSAPWGVEVTDDDVIRVRLDTTQWWTNVLPNASFDERNQGGGVRDWTASGATLSDSVVSITAADGSAVSDRFRLPSEAPHTLRVVPDPGITITVRLFAALGDAASAQEIIVSGEETTFTPTAAPFASLDIRGAIGSVYHLGLFEGEAAPRKRYGRDPVNAAEPLRKPYPGGLYCVLVENPDWAEGKGNGIEYYGASRMGPARTRFLYGGRFPVSPGEVLCFSASYEHRGSSTETELMPITIRDEDGQVLDAPGAIAPDVSGTGSGRGHVVLDCTDLPDAAYLQIESSELGAGLVRAWGFQFEAGNAPTEWTDDFATSGIVTVTFDTAPPGISEAASAITPIFKAKRWTEIGTISDLPTGTSVPIRVRAKDSPSLPFGDYSEDPATVFGKRIIEVELRPQTTDPDETPEISEVFLEGEPVRAILFDIEGNHFPGGIYVEGVPATQYDDNAELVRMSDGEDVLREFYRAPKVLTDMTLRGYSDAGAHAVNHASTHGERLCVLEGWGFRRVVRMINVRMAANRFEKIAEDHHTHEATGVAMRIVSEEPFE